MMPMTAIFANPLIGNDPDKLVVFNVVLLPSVVSMFMFGMLGIWFFRLAAGLCQSAVDFLLRSSGFPGDSSTIQFKCGPGIIIEY